MCAGTVRRDARSVADVSDRRLDALLRALPPAPERLVARVLEIPLLEGALAHLRRGRGRHRTTPARLHDALSDAGLEPDDARVRMLGELRWRRLERETGSENSPSEVARHEIVATRRSSNPQIQVLRPARGHGSPLTR